MGHSRTIELLKAPSGPRSRVAVGYCRRSTDRQEQSIPDQQSAIERAANQRSLALARIYIDDALTGTTTIGRRSFQRMVKDAQQPNCPLGWIVVYDVKRFGRGDNDEAGYYRHILKTHGVNVYYCSENFTGDRSDDLIRSVKQWHAREESRDLAKVTVRGLISRATEIEARRSIPRRRLVEWRRAAIRTRPSL